MSTDRNIDNQLSASPGDKASLAEMQRVLDQQSKVIHNQRKQATKILRVILTFVGLLFTLVSILISIITSDLLPSLSDLIGDLTIVAIPRAVISLIVLYALVLVAGAFLVIFVSSFEVLSPTTGNVSDTLVVDALKPDIDISKVNRIIDIYEKIVPFVQIPIVVRKYEFNKYLEGKYKLKGDKMEDYEVKMSDSNEASKSYDDDNERFSFRPGIDGEEARNLASSSNKNKIHKILDYNSGCIEKNEELIEQNRTLLANIYATSIILSTSLTGIIVLSLGFMLLPES